MPSIPRRFLLRRTGVIAACACALALLVAPRAEADPVSIAPPVISGTLQVGQTLSVTKGEWTDPSSPITSYSYEWLRCEQSICVIISGATSSTYTLQDADDGQSIDAAVEAMDAQGQFNGAQAEQTFTITDPGLTPPSAPGVLGQPQAGEAQPVVGQPASATPAPETGAASSSLSPVSVAQLLTVRATHRHVQAQVRCEQASPCRRLSLAVFALLGGDAAVQTSGVRHALIAQRSFSVGAEHSTRVSLALTRTGARLLRAHGRLPVVAVLTPSGSGADPLSESRLTITA